jgi:hypothetical protein
MIDLTKPEEIGDLKKAFDYSFKGPLGEKTLAFLEQFCGFYSGGPRDDLNRLQYEAGKRDVILTIKTISNPDWNPEQIAQQYKRSE